MPRAPSASALARMPPTAPTPLPTTPPTTPAPLVGVIMGSKRDFDQLAPAVELLAELGVSHEARVVSAHRTPEWMVEYAKSAESRLSFSTWPR